LPNSRTLAEIGMRVLRTVLLLTVALGACEPADRIRVGVTFTEELEAEALDGRLLLILAEEGDTEPRFMVNAGQSAQPLFGLDVEAWRPGQTALFTDSVFGFPMRLGELPPGAYRAQAVLNRYETFHRSDGHVVKLPPDRGEGQQWHSKPGNLVSTPVSFTVSDDGTQTLDLVLDAAIPELPDPSTRETDWVKYVRLRSELLSDFWGRDVYLGAWVLLPEGFDEHPEARYPVAVFHGHFPIEFGHMRTEPPDPDLPCTYSARFRLDCYNRVTQEGAYQLFQDWTAADFPRMLVVEIQHPTPFYDDSYAVNSENNGPYGDALTYELIPYIEQQYRGIGEGWARFTYGGSTGGWEAMAVQVFYPDEYNGAWVACPDPIDFRAYGTVNIYDDRNAYFADSRFKRTPRPAQRNWLGFIDYTVEEVNRFELALATKTRSGQQWDIWEAVFSPVGDDGYPRRIWDKVTGEIDPEVAAYWRDNYDLVHILRRDWATLGPKLVGKLNIYVGDMDNYYLNNAVYLAEEFLEATTNPYYGGEVDYGDRAEHCWNGDQTRENAYSRLRYIQMFAPRIVERIEANHPQGADLTSWRY